MDLCHHCTSFLVGFIILVICIEGFVTRKQSLSAHVSYFEPVKYLHGTTIFTDGRKINNIDELHLDFIAHGRHFKVFLRCDHSLFSQDIKLKDGEEFQLSNIYEGYLSNEPLSYVHGFIHDDIFEGYIRSSDGNEYYIESSKQYDDGAPIASVIYNANDYIHNGPYVIDHINPVFSDRQSGVESETEVPSKNHFTDILREHHNMKNKRQKRSTDSRRESRACSVQLRADPTYVVFANGDKTRAMYMMVQHIKAVRNIFELIDFDGDNIPDGYSLVIKNISIIDTSSCNNNQTTTECRISMSNIEKAEDFLNLVSMQDNSEFCLSYVFCHRNFKYGKLGMAWQGFPDKRPGGICSTVSKSNDGIIRTLNTGIVTNIIDDKIVSKTVIDRILAHEIAHSFGSSHDDRQNRTCVPGGVDGNFLMYPEAQYGSGRNTFMLSPCSKAEIQKNLELKSGRCFEKQSPICGNKEVEPGEDCDCGFENEISCRNDPCCQGASLHNLKNLGCTFTAKARNVSVEKRCSPSQGFCCNPATCSPFKNNSVVCREASECRSKASKCIESSYSCPKSEFVPERSLCDNGAKTCIKGECSGSVCLLVDKWDCQCTDEKYYCYVCCKDKNDSSLCVKYGQKDVQKPPGSLCNQDKGRCENSKCLLYDEKGLLFTRIKKWFSKKFVKLYTWAQKNWWVCLLITIFVLTVIVISALVYLKYIHSNGCQDYNHSNEKGTDEVPLQGNVV